MSRYQFELAGEGDDADLRHVLAHTPMPGRVALSFRREPSYFEGARVDGRFRQVVACRETATGRVVGFGSRSVELRYVNGRPEPVGYLSSLRLLEEHRNRGLVARGYAYLKKLHADGRARLYLTTIAEGNRPALALLTSGRAGLPAYHFAGNYHTLALPLGRQRRPWWSRPKGIEVRPAQAEDLGTVSAFFRKVGPARQFFPFYEESDLGTGEGLLRDLSLGQVLLAFRGGELAGSLAGWDQHGFRQTVVEGYGGALRWARPLYNLGAHCLGWPLLPAPGRALRYLTAALPVVAHDDLEVFAALVEALQARAAGPQEYLLLGLHESDPLLAAVSCPRAARYTTRLYLVCWEDGEGLRKGLDGRPPYLELGSL